MLPLTLLLGLAALTAAQPTALEADGITVTVQRLSDPDVRALDVSSPASSFDMPVDVIEPFVHASPTTTKAPSRARSAGYTVTTAECLNTHYAPRNADCRRICASFHDPGQPKSFTLQPLQSLTLRTGDCAFSVANLESCESITLDPYASLANVCGAFANECAAHGHDGYVQYAHPQMGFVLSGQQGAPPYGSDTCDQH